MTIDDPAPDAISPAEGAVLADGPGDGAAHPVLEQAFDAGTLYALRAAVQAHVTRLGMSKGRTDDLVIAVHELAANAVRHGAGGGHLRMWERDGAVHCQVQDSGVAAQQNGGPGDNPADSWPYAQGHGLWLARLVADEISVVSGPDGTCAIVVFGLPGPGLAGPDPAAAEPG